MARQERKLEHLWHAVRTELTYADFSEVDLVHNCLPETSLETIDLSTSVAGIKLPVPVFINAITGGVEDAENINRNLAEIAKECRLALAVGSQMAALENPDYLETFRVVRKEYPDGVIFANIGAYADSELAKRAVDMIQADALQIHVNVPQELMMAEGDTDFCGCKKRIEEIICAVPVPVIIKEVGFGVAKEQAYVLQELGAAAIDVGGKGGTNFMQIERRRAHLKTSEDLLNWGIPTPVSIMEARTGAPAADIIATGGINSGLLAAKSIALGASAAGVAGMAVKLLLSEGPEVLKKRFFSMLEELKIVMMMTGCYSVSQLKKAPVVITGKTREWMEVRQLHR